MSSFVIGKAEYVKAAGIVAGIFEAKDLWLFDYKENRKADRESFYNRFVECFEMNMLSVQEQYNDTEPETDGGDYRKRFDQYYHFGKQIAFHPEKLKKVIMELHRFFDSAIYQTETYSYMFQMQMYFFSITNELMPLLYSHDCKSWGSLKLDDIA